jgi:hypothetical protein
MNYEKWERKTKYKFDPAIIVKDKKNIEIVGIFGVLEFATYNEAQSFLTKQGYVPVNRSS